MVYVCAVVCMHVCVCVSACGCVHVHIYMRVWCVCTPHVTTQEQFTLSVLSIVACFGFWFGGTGSSQWPRAL